AVFLCTFATFRNSVQGVGCAWVAGGRIFAPVEAVDGVLFPPGMRPPLLRLSAYHTHSLGWQGKGDSLLPSQPSPAGAALWMWRRASPFFSPHEGGPAVSALSHLVTHCLRRLLSTQSVGYERQQFLGGGEVRGLA